MADVRVRSDISFRESRASGGFAAHREPLGRLLTVEILAAGAEGVEHYDTMVGALGRRLDAGWVRVTGMLALIGKLVMAGEASRLPSLDGELVVTLSLQVDPKVFIGRNMPRSGNF